jgi:excinuclease UvrABC nuclease subunit
MLDLNKLYRTYKDKLENYFKDNNSQLENKKQTLVKQWKNLAFIILNSAIEYC